MPTATYTPLATITLTGTDSTISFTSIPSTYKHLVLQMSVRSSINNPAEPMLRFNNDAGANYASVGIYGTGSAVSGFNLLSQSHIKCVQIAKSGAVANSFTPIRVEIINYTETTLYKNVVIRNSETNSDGIVGAFSGRWAGTSAINRIDVVASDSAFTVGSVFSLYGIVG